MNDTAIKQSILQKANAVKISGIPLFIYLAITALVAVCMVLDWLPGGMIGALAIMMVFGFLLNAIGDNLPIVKTFLGGGAIVCIFGSASMVSAGLIPASVIENVDTFMNATGFLNFYIAALITGSILGMDRKLLLKASLRFLPVALSAMTFAVLMVGAVGWAVGFGFKDAIMYIAIPMMGGGMGAGVVPMSGIYAAELGVEASEIISRMVPASTLGNCMAIIGAGLLAKLGEVKPSLSGNGKLMVKQDDSLNQKNDDKPDLQTLGMGLILSASFYLLGTVVNKFLPFIHTYAWMIILVALTKAIGIIPKSFENATQQWSKFVMKNWTSALLVGIGISLIDLKAVAAAISPVYLLLVIVVVGGVALGAGIGGRLVGFYPVESAVTAGLCTTNMGGTGDVAVLSACKRMELLPFAQISTRICGALVLILASILVKIML
ncbi:CCS family citrate carrier protein [Hydrogenoanaerobacterium saccharovorans]|uniref:Citrate carrier protein, CCS family n=1 Tax=Hydrogenoanaerobacterium saccharovorans TaxID=474960 RepID=A0A1H8A7Y3_9FIRM|nr:2-hydroxycarboxylate transporter family protein [Hydrogenoanaerobacterium saccharovorans]RPF48090.1 CCS family citrate carrier protein [Hydrogenoanaerobacterium saccharovorans]SEM67002.1 citrate carrier protein, CCS family [Hydrogenoanaerobacterium saccharovorans]